MKKLNVILAVLAAAAMSNAATRTWVPTGTGDWSVPANWGGTVPIANDDPYINNGGTAQITSGTVTPTLRNTYIGVNSGNSGTLEMTGGTLNSARLVAGRGGAGVLTIGSGAVANTTSDTGAGTFAATGTGTINVSGVLSKTGSGFFQIGGAGTGTLNVYAGGSVTSSVNVVVGLTNTANGTVYLAGSMTAASVTLANYEGATGLFTLDGGSLTLTGDFDMDNQGAAGISGNSKLRVIGSDGTFSVGGVFRANGSEYSVVDMIADAGGFTTIESAGNIGINGTLNIDLSSYAGDFSTPLVLMQSTGGGLFGTFDTVNITGGTGSESVVYGPSGLMLIPEPATIGMVGLGTLLMFVIRRARR